MRKFWKTLITGGAIGATLGTYLFLRKRRNVNKLAESGHMLAHTLSEMSSEIADPGIRNRMIGRRTNRSRQ